MSTGTTTHVSIWKRAHLHRREHIALWVLGALIAASVFWINRAFFHDDAYISLRYARNLLEGHGLVWNPGESVQGYTNFLHLLVVTAMGTVMDLRFAAQLLGVLCWAAIVGVIAFHPHLRSTSPDEQRITQTLVAVCVLPAAPLVVWSLGGLEGPWVALLVLVAVLAVPLDGRRPSTTNFLVAGLFWAFACLSRPDAALLLVVAAGYLALHFRTRRVLWLMAAPALLGGLYFLWAWHTYGSLLPNTFHAKVGIERMHRWFTGVTYVGGFLRAPPLWLAAFVPALLILRRSRGHLTLQPLEGLLLLLSGVYLIYVCYAGGDHMPAYRLVLPILPLLMALTVKLWGRAIRSAGSALPVVLGFLLLSALQVGHQPLMPAQEDPAAHVGRIVGQYIADNWPEGSVVALHTAGSTPYYASKHRFIDMLGLNDRHIARVHVDEYLLPWQRVPGHAKGDGAYVLSRRPDFIILGAAQGTAAQHPIFLSDIQLAAEEDFHRLYTMHRIALPRSRPSDRQFAFTYFALRGGDAGAVATPPEEP